MSYIDTKVDVVFDIVMFISLFYTMLSATRSILRNTEESVDAPNELYREKCKYIPIYIHLNNCFLRCWGWPSQLVLGVRSLAYLLTSFDKTSFINPNGLPYTSNSMSFFMAKLDTTFYLCRGCKTSIASSMSHQSLLL